MTSTLAYEIGAAFFLAVLLMGGSMMRGLFPQGLFKNIKLAVIVLVAGLAAMAAYQNLPSAWGSAFSQGGTAGTVQTQPVTPQPAPKHPPAAGKIRDAEYVIKAKPQDVGDALEAAPTQAQDGPVIVRPSEDADKPESRSRKVVKSVGRILHLGHKKDPADQ